jgi:DNA mismatch repair ATPase MutS
MIEMNYILNNFTDDSLILIDELCRSTSTDEGKLWEKIMSSLFFIQIN